MQELKQQLQEMLARVNFEEVQITVPVVRTALTMLVESAERACLETDEYINKQIEQKTMANVVYIGKLEQEVEELERKLLEARIFYVQGRLDFWQWAEHGRRIRRWLIEGRSLHWILKKVGGKEHAEI